MAWTVIFCGTVNDRFALKASDGVATREREYRASVIDDVMVKDAAKAFVAELDAEVGAKTRLTLRAGDVVSLD